MGLHPRVAAGALEALAKHGKGEAYETVSYYMHHRSARVRSAAVKAMGSLNDKRAKKLVLNALSDSHKSVRAAAASILALPAPVARRANSSWYRRRSTRSMGTAGR